MKPKLFFLLSGVLPIVTSVSVAQNAPQASIAVADEPINLLGNGDFGRGEEGWSIPNERAEFAFVPAPKLADGKLIGERVLRLMINPEIGENSWDIALRQGIDAKIAKDTPLVFRGWMRSPQSTSIGVFVEENGGAYAKSLGATIKLSPEWKEYEIRGQAKQDFAAGGANFVMHLGATKATVELSNLRLFDPTQTAQGLGHSTATPNTPQSLIENGDFGGDLAASWNGVASATGAPVQASPMESGRADWPHALRLQVSPPPNAQPWSLKLSQKATQFIGRDDAIYVRVWLRSPQRARAALVFEQASEPFTKFINQTVRLTPQWKEYRFAGTAPRSFAPGEAQFNIFVGYGPGTIDVGHVRVENYGRAPRSMFDQTVDYWGGLTPDDSWRTPALQRIEQLRKGDVHIRVVDAKGRAVRGAQVQIEQQQHFFRWGTAGTLSRLLDDQSPNSLRVQQMTRKLFNSFVFESDLKWPNSEQSGTLDKIDRGVAWLQANGIRNIRGHNFVWGSEQYLPQRVHNLDKEATIAALRERVQTIGARMSGKVYVWDVVNEAADNTWLWDKIGWENFADVYRWARQADSKVLLAYNDFHAFGDANDSARQREYQRIQYLIDHGAPFDIIGEQAHLGAPLIPIAQTLQRMDELAEFGKRIEITEFDVGIQDDKVHGEYTRDFLTAMFSHPQIDAFLMWGFWEGAHWRAAEGGAIFRRDWTPRPAAQIYQDLVFKQWWTRAAGRSSDAGIAWTRAFYGTHNVTVSRGKKRVTQQISLLPNGEKNFTVVLK